MYNSSRSVHHVSATHAKQHLAETLRRAGQEPVAVERHGKVLAVMVSPEAFDQAQTASPEAAERCKARLQQALVEKDRLIRHQRIAIDLLSLPTQEAENRVRAARAEVARWRSGRLCSADYIDRWSALLCLPVPDLARAMGADLEGWGPALRQNSPWVGVSA